MMKVRKLSLSIRAYSSRKNKKFIKHVKNTTNANPGIQNRLRLYQKDELASEISAGHEFDDLHEDIDQFESDFMNAGKSHRLHERELEIRKEKLKNQITFSKYFKEVEPSFLTFAEKEQIKSLHESDPNEWSVEKLSESFPALPQTIKKVLHAKWVPKSVEAILRYDEKVISNWETFQAGELPLSPALKKHLKNFKERQIILTDREKLAKRFVLPKMEFPKPKSKLFARIAETFLLPSFETKANSPDKNTDTEVNEDFYKRNTAFEAKEDFNFDKGTDLQLKKILEYSNFETQKNFNEVRSLTIQGRKKKTEIVSSGQKNKMTFLSKKLNEDGHQQNNKRLTFDEFFKKNVGQAEKSTSSEDIVLKETYKKHMEKITLFQSKPAASYSSTESESEETVSKVSKSERNLFSSKEEKADSELAILNNRTRETEMSSLIQMTQTGQILRSENRELSSGLYTYVKEWHKKGDEADDIPPFINIPKHRYKAGMTYRVKNCYYDDDGEFLYKVPGLHN